MKDIKLPKDKYSLTVRDSQMHLLTGYPTTTAVFKSSYCTKCVFVFDNEQDLIKAKSLLK